MLRGSGAVLGLPLLDAMIPSARGAEAGEPPVRMAVMFMPNGVNPHHWTPKKNGRDFDLPSILQPLKQVQDDILVLTHLTNRKSKPGDGHYVKVSGLLTGQTINKTTGHDLNSGGISMDQLAAQRIGSATRFPSLEIGIEPITVGVDSNVGYTRLYGSHIAWSSPTSPLPCELNPELLFNRLFRKGAGQRALSYEDRGSILDLVYDDAKRLHNGLGKRDQQKLDEYLTSVRAVEKRIAGEAAQRQKEVRLDAAAQAEIKRLSAHVDGFANKHPDEQAYQITRSGNHTEYTRLMLDIMVLALWTDTTRISTFMFGNAVSSKNFSFLDGVDGGFHHLSHHQGDKAKLEMYRRINVWHLQQYAYVLDRMKSIKEGEGTLLDNSMVMFGSALRDGNQHDPHNVPIVLAGRGGGTLDPGRHITYGKDTPLCNLYVSMLKRVGAPVERFSDSTGELGQLG
jgi:hypothetical protein